MRFAFQQIGCSYTFATLFSEIIAPFSRSSGSVDEKDDIQESIHCLVPLVL